MKYPEPLDKTVHYSPRSQIFVGDWNGELGLCADLLEWLIVPCSLLTVLVSPPELFGSVIGNLSKEVQKASEVLRSTASWLPFVWSGGSGEVSGTARSLSGT